jgi:hypothetical protein
MRKLIFLGAFLLTLCLLPNAVRGQQGQAMLKIVKSNDGSVKVYDLLGNAINESFPAAIEPAAPIGRIPSALGTDSAKQTGDAPAAILNPGPDLTFPFPPSASFSAPYLTLNTWIMNNGTDPSGPCYVGYYLQPVSNPNMHIELGTERVDPLVAGESRQYTQTFNLSLHPGSWYVCWAVDFTGLVAEDNEANNVFIASNMIDLPGPNLTLQGGYYSLTFDEITDQLHINVRIINTGTVTAGSSVLAFYFEDKELGDLPVFSMSPGSYSDKSFTISDVCENYGYFERWFLIIMVDQTDAVVETNENDNIYVLPIHLPCPHPNLTMQSIPNSFQYDSSTRRLDLKVRVINDGTLKAESSVMGFYLSTDTDISTSDPKLGDVPVFSLNPGSYSDKSFGVNDVCNYVSPGTWYAGVIIDETNAVAESNETDNTYSFTPSITLGYHLSTEVNPAGSGSVRRDPDKPDYSYKETLKLTAIAAPGYRFDHWSGALNGNDNPAILSMNEDKDITAFFVGKSSSTAILVTNCSDAGPGSLRAAITMANTHSGPDTILFAIPEGVPGYQADAGIWVIQPRTELPPISDSQLLMDGFSQVAFIGRDSNPYGPEIVLDGQAAGQNANGFHVTASKVTIVGIIVNRYDSVGIWMDHVDIGCIAGCYIGIDYRGMLSAPNGWGICIGNRCRQVTVAPADTFRNVITGNLNGGILVSDSSQAITILSNIIGLNRSANAAPGNGGFGGLCIQEHCDGVIVVDNRIGGNACGLLINNSIHNTIQSNWIGISPENLDPKPGDLIPITGNKSDGIYILGESRDNLISKNIICQNGGAGIGIYGELPLRNRISQNCIAQNDGPAIFYESAGANRVSAPTITRASSTSVSGTAIPDATVEIYTDAEDEGQLFQGQTQSGTDGRFEWTGVIQGTLPHVTAITINAEGTTSPFSMLFSALAEEPDRVSAPVSFTLAQNYPNPFNPETAISYTLTAISGIRLTVYDVLGKEVAILVDEVKQPGVYKVIFNAVDFPSGLYYYTLEAGSHIMTRKMMLLK